MSGPRQLTPAELAALEQIAKASAPSLTPVPLWQRDPFTTGAKTTPEPYVAPSMRAPTTRERVGDAVRGVGSSLAALPPVQAALKLLAQAAPHLDEATYGQAKPGTGWSLGMMPDVPQKGTIRAYHGSPHKFDKFSMEKIGTGEGNQVYGHGLYFAENEKVAEGYRKNLAGTPKPEVLVSGTRLRKPELPSPADNVVDDLERHAVTTIPFAPDRTIRDVESWYDGEIAHFTQKLANERELIAAGRGDYGLLRAWEGYVNGFTKRREVLRQWKEQGLDVVLPEKAGATYEVAIKADPDTLLDWDAPLTQQPEPVRKALPEYVEQEAAYKERYPSGGLGERRGSNIYSHLVEQETRAAEQRRVPTTAIPKDGYYEVRDADGEFVSNVIGAADEYEALAEAKRRLGDSQRARVAANGPALAAQRLRERGIPGLKYLDGLSRGAGQGSHNYVIWDDNLIEILRQYGLLGLLGGGLAAQQVRGFTPTQEAR